MAKFEFKEEYDDIKDIKTRKEFESAMEQLKKVGQVAGELAESLKQYIEDNKMEDIEVLENVLKDYNYQPNSPTGQFIKHRVIALNTKNDKIKINKNVKAWEEKNEETGQTSYKYLTGKDDYEIIFEDLNFLKSRSSVYFRKTLNFILQKANEQNTPKNIYFDLSEYQERTGYKSKDTAYRGAVRHFEALRGISIGGVIKRGKKEIRNKTSYIFIAKDISYNQCFIECKPEIVDMMSQYFTLLPKWAGELNTKAYDLLDYIFYRARQSVCSIRENNKFNISLKSINDYIGGHDPEDTQRHAQLIIEPILNAINEIEDTQRGEKLYITPIYNHEYTNAYEFLDGGYIEVKLGEEATEYFCNRSKDRDKKIKKATKK